MVAFNPCADADPQFICFDARLFQRPLPITTTTNCIWWELCFVGCVEPETMRQGNEWGEAKVLIRKWVTEIEIYSTII